MTHSSALLEFMDEWVDRRSRIWASVAIVAGAAFFFSLEVCEEPQMSALDMALELFSIVPVVMMSVGVVLLFRITSRQREEQRTLLRDREVARLQGQRWRAESRSLLNGLGDAIDAQ